MADKKISALTAATTPLAGTEVLPIVQGGTTDKVSVANLTAGRAVDALSVATTAGVKNTSAGSDSPSSLDGVLLTDAGTKAVSIQLGASGQLSTFVFEPIAIGWRRVAALLTNGNSVVDVGNLVIGTAGKGITTGGATALGLGVNNAVDAVTIDASSNVRVGTNTFIVSSSEKFSIDCGAGNGLTTKTSGGAATWNHFVWNAGTSGNNGFIEFGTEASYTARGSITYNRGAGQVAYNVTSDARLKTNVADAADAGEIVDAIKVRQFDWAETGVRMHYGFVAQELYKAAPIAVTKPDDDDAMWSVDYSKLVPILVKEIQSLRARVAQLEGN